MPLPAGLVPTTAERIRSVCARAGDALLAVEGAEPINTPLHHLLDDGSFAVAVPADCAGLAAVDGAPAMLELADHAPLRLRAPVRSLVWIAGHLQDVPLGLVPAMLDLIATEDPSPTLLQVETLKSGRSDDDTHPSDTRYRLLRFVITSVVMADATGADSVDAATLVAAQPDPFTAIESRWLQHLDSAHRAVVARLASRLPATLRRGEVRLLGLDRYGVQFRIESDGGDRDVRLPFHRPVYDVTGLNQAIRMLIGCPFGNGVRARHA